MMGTSKKLVEGDAVHPKNSIVFTLMTVGALAMVVFRCPLISQDVK